MLSYLNPPQYEVVKVTRPALDGFANSLAIKDLPLHGHFFVHFRHRVKR
jgi:hypothetical protein